MLKNPPIDQFSSVENVGAAIRLIPDGHHITLLYQNKEVPRLLHLTVDGGIIDTEPTDEYCWLQCGLDKFNTLVVSALCRDISLKISSSVQRVAYRFKYNGDYFDPSGNYVADASAGLTCSTFVLAVFRTLNIELVNVQSWPEATLDDIRARLGIIVTLESKEFPINSLRDEWGEPRFTPTQVAAAISVSDHPMSYDIASKSGKKIEAKLKKVRDK